jgi:hypothetical protein
LKIFIQTTARLTGDEGETLSDNQVATHTIENKNFYQLVIL